MNDLQINYFFDRQINNKYDPNSRNYIIHKKLYNYTKNFKLQDWKNIRTEKYWEIVQTMQNDIDRKKYLLKCIENYLNI